MRKHDYKNYFDNIKCRPEFKTQMEEILSSESDGEYADSVKDIEYAPKINYHSWMAVAASFILIAGLGGAVFFGLKNSYSEPVYSNTDNSDETDSAIIESTDTRYSVELSMTGGDSTNYITNFGKFSDEFFNKIIETIENAEWIETDIDYSLIVDSIAFITLEFMDEKNTVFQIYRGGEAVLIESDNTKKYYIHDVYYDIISVIANYIPYCDWTSMVDGETGIALDTAFKNHADEITTDGIADGFEYPSDETKEFGLKFFENGEFKAYIQPNGDLSICFKGIDDINHTISNKRIYFGSSPELYNDIAMAVNSRSDRFFNLVDETVAGNTHMAYTSGTSQDSQSIDFEGINIDKLCSAIKSLDWTLTGSELPSGECFIAGDFLITMNGKIYSTSESVLYSAENQDYSAINNAIDEIIKTDDVGYMMYLIASSENKFSTMSGDINLYYAEDNIIGKGKFYYDSNNHDEYINIESVSSSALFVMNQGEWVYSGKNQDNIDFSKNGFRFYDTPLIEYTWIKDVILSHLQAINTSETKSIAVMETGYGYNFTLDYINDEDKNIVVSVNIDSIGNVTGAEISEHLIGDDGHTVINQELKFSVGDGTGGGIIYDSPYFVIPQSFVNHSAEN